MKPIVYNGRDHASIQSGKMSAYYGSEQTDPNTGDWCAVIWKNSIGGQKEVARYTTEQLLDVAGGESPKDMLLAGIALYFSK